MKLNKVKSILQRAAYPLVLPAATLFVAHFGWANAFRPVDASWGFAALLLVAVATLGRRWRRGERKLNFTLQLLFGFSFALLILLSASLIQAVIFAVVYAAVLAGLELKLSENWRLLVGGLLQFVGLWAVFLSGAIWHWPMLLFLLLTYAVSYVVAIWLVDGYEERSRLLMATAWGLISTECAYIFSIWLVNYILRGGWVILPQAALVITALGYVFSSIYLAHKNAKLGRWRLAEYLLIGLLLIVIVVVGTKWSGSI